MLSRLFRIVIILTTVFSLIACEESSDIVLTDFSIEPTSIELAIGESVPLQVYQQPSDASGLVINWKSSDESVAVVSDDGVVKAISAGDATITASAGGMNAFCSVTVMGPSIFYYTTIDGKIIEPDVKGTDVAIVSNTYIDGQGVIVFDGIIPNITLRLFKRCENLWTIVLPESVKSIENAAFGGCGYLRFVTVLSATPPEVGENIFYSRGYKYVCVPAHSLEAYRSAWSKYSDIIMPIKGPAAVKMERGEAMPLDAIAGSDTANYSSLNWTSSDTSVAEVDSNGMVTAKSIGTATIVAVSEEVEIRCTLTVVDSYTLYYTTTDGMIVKPNYSIDLDLDGVVDWDWSSSVLSNTYENGRGALVFEVPPKALSSCAFEDCTTLTSVILPDGLRSIEWSAFRGCNNLKSIIIPDNVSYIRGDVFYGCSSLERVVVPRGVTTLGESGSVFAGCSSLSAVELPSGLKEIGGNNFSACISLTEIELPQGLERIGWWAFSDCSSLKSIVIPDSVTFIGESTFRNCTSLVSVVLPNSITSIEQGTFDHCSSLERITIPEFVATIGGNAFSNCDNLKYIIMLPQQPPILFAPIPQGYICVPAQNYDVYKSSVYADRLLPMSGIIMSQAELKMRIGETSSLEVVFGPDADPNQHIDWISGDTSIAVVDEYGNVTAVSAGDVTITAVARDMSAVCNLTVVPLTELYYTSYDGQEVEIKNIPSVVSNVYEDGQGVITIEGILTRLPNGAFINCKNLTGIVVPQTVKDIEGLCFYGCDRLTTVTLPDGLISIGESAFSGCSSLTSIDIPEGVTAIGQSCFSHCSKLKRIGLPNGVTNIANWTFSGCTSLTDIVISNSVTTIGWSAFNSCQSLSHIELPDGLSSIGESAFYGCSELEKIVIPNSVVSIDQTAFMDCHKLQGIELPDGLTILTAGLLWNCHSLKSIIIPDSVTSLGGRVFTGCYSLTSIVIPKNVTGIGGEVFLDCYSLQKITVLSETPPELGPDSIPIEVASIYVPASSLETYKSASGWNEYADRLKPII